MSPAPTLRDYQTRGLLSISTQRQDGLNRLLIKMPTGTGKTVMFAEMLKWPTLKSWLETFPERERRMLVIAHREELLTQAASKIQIANPGLMVAIEQADRHASRYADVIVASIQTLSAGKFRRLQRLLHTMPPFRVVIVDEAHHAAAATYRTALVHLGFLPPADATEQTGLEAANFDDVAVMTQALKGWDAVAPQDRLLVGVTATPNRSDAIGLGCVFQTIAYNYDLKAAIDDGWLVPITPWVVETQSMLDQVRTSHGDFNQRELAEAVNTAKRNDLAVKSWQQYAEGLSTLAFTVDVAHAHSLADAFCRSGVDARALSGETPREERRQLLADFLAGKVQVITNCMVLTEGTDLPLTGCILHAKPTKSATLYEQMTGRGLRIHPGKTECVVIDLVDVAKKHSLQTAPVLYGLPPGLNGQGKTLKELADALEALRDKVPGFDLEQALAASRLSLEQLQVRAQTFDIWSVPSLGAFGNGRALDWMKISDDRYRLSYPWQDGYEQLEVAKDMLGHFDVSLTLRPAATTVNGQTQYQPVRQRTLAAGIKTADEAAGIAEAWVLAERRTVAKLRDKDAPWKQRPASPKQIALLQRLRVPFRPKLTMGEASNLIDLARVRRAR